MPSDPRWRNAKHRWIAAGFAFVGGYADIISVVRYTAFATMCTGNTIYLAQELVKHPRRYDESFGAVFYITIILCFFFGVCLHRAVELRCPNRAGSAVGIPLAMFLTITELVMMFHGGDVFFKPLFRYTVAAVSPLFGVVCSASATGRLGTATTMVTGHILSLGNACANCLFVKRPEYGERQKIWQSLSVILFSIAGASAGTGVLLLAGKRSEGLFLPVGPALAILLWCHDHLAKPRSIVKRIHARRRRNSSARSSGSEESDEGSELPGILEEGDMLHDGLDEDADEAEGDESETDSGQEAGSGPGARSLGKARRGICDGD